MGRGEVQNDAVAASPAQGIPVPGEPAREPDSAPARERAGDVALDATVDAEQLRRLGEALSARTDDVVAGIRSRSRESGPALDAVVEDSFVRVGTVSTLAVARWMCGEGAVVAREVGQESWRIFGHLAAQREAPLNEVTKRCLRWRDAADDVLRETAAELEIQPEVLDWALGMLQRSLDVTLVRMCQSFESERQRAHVELTRRQEELAFLATHDALTGLPNRTLILDRVEQMLVRSRRSQSPVAALFVDLDNFKSINDTLGHGVGDELLRAVAARLDGVVRDIDALGRLGGDEFVIVAEGMSLDSGPEMIAERVLDALKQPFELPSAEQSRLTVMASIGIAAGDRVSAEELLRDADIAMYRAKWDGKNRYVVFESGMQDAVQSRMELEMDLRAAFENEEFFLVYQPTFDLQAMTPTGMEALIRWRSPVRGIVQPDDFIPLLEETGLICEVGAWVLREASRQGAAWRREGFPVGIAVNVSARQLDTDEFVAEVRAALADSELEPCALTLEITETTLMSNADETARRLVAIKELGARIAIDDFGTGYSSLAYLQRFPVDALKIDRSFISRVSQDPEGDTLIRTLVQLGKSLSIETLAEGIEQSRELSLLKEENCDSGQGFLFARPLELEACDLFLRDWIGGNAPADDTGTNVTELRPDVRSIAPDFADNARPETADLPPSA
jgi:diguanylate cyclase (GGDEF)-like protein